MLGHSIRPFVAGDGVDPEMCKTCVRVLQRELDVNRKRNYLIYRNNLSFYYLYRNDFKSAVVNINVLYFNHN